MSERWVVDTNVLLRATDAASDKCHEARESIAKLGLAGKELVLLPQVAVEFWVVATRPIANNGLGWDCGRASREIDLLAGMFPLLPEGPTIFEQWRKLVDQYEVLGKRAHDARIVAAMVAHGIPSILTFNESDFDAFTQIHVFTPQDILAR